MKEAKEKNLFLIPLDPAGEWYRYHHLFRSQIRQYSVKYFNEQVVEVLHKATSSWFEEKGLLEEALNYATRSKDMTFALGLFSRFRHNLLNREQLQRLDRLTHQFPEDIRNNNPEILLILAILQHYNANFNGMQQYLSRAEELLYGQSDRDDHEKQLIGEFHAVSTYFSYMRGDFEKAIHHGEKSMEFLPACKPNFFREHSTGWYAFAQQACGQASAGMDRLESEYRALANADQYFQMRLLQGKLIFNLFEGNTAHLYQDGSSLANLCSPKTYPGSWVIGIYSMAYHSYVNNKPEKVSGLHDELRKYRFACRPFWVIQYFFIECLSYMAEEVWPNVEQCIAECEELAQKLAMEPFQGMVKAFQVEYYLKRHDVDRAREVSALANFEPQPPNFFYYIPQLTQVKLLFQTQQEEKGQVMLQDLLEMGRSRHNKNLLIQALTLQAVIHFRHKRKEQAKSVLHEALKIAESKGVLRPFLDHGQIMHHLLKDIAEDQPNNIQVIELLHAFDADQNSATFNDPAPGRNQEQELNALSKREIEILTLVTQGFKNKEIAKKLFISLDTVKKHLYRAYQKLDVKNRLSAIKRANELGLLFNSLVQKPKEE
ncbi:MAG: hypothetical protein HC819_21770 [Cyclobacteriaceae bacterium]|nr:hypothetical protein [Cyclobacteriaceae bacterium]